MQKLAENNKKVKKICLSGGGSGGPVSPLLAIYDELKQENYDFIWVGTKNGVEKQMVEEVGVKFFSIYSGKLRRYFSFDNFIDVFKIFIAFFQSLFLLWHEKPNLIITAGAFVSVPLVWAGKFLSIPIIVHQQDVRAGLANKLMVPFAKIITVTFKKSLKDFGKKAIWVGNPHRKSLEEVINKDNLYFSWNLKKDLPIVLVMGGGGGAQAINNLLYQSLNELDKFCQIIHISGVNKGQNNFLNKNLSNYHHFEFLNNKEMREAYALSDVVVARAGMSTLTELSYLGKPSIIIPMPDSHQEENAQIVQEKNAGIVLHQKKLDAENFAVNIKKLLFNNELKEKVSTNISHLIKKDANLEFVKIIKKIL